MAFLPGIFEIFSQVVSLSFGFVFSGWLVLEMEVKHLIDFESDDHLIIRWVISQNLMASV